MNIKSPFYIVENFISPLLCEDIVDMLNFITPNVDKDGREIKTIKTCQQAELIIFDRIRGLIPQLQEYYNIQYKGTEEISFEMIPCNSTPVVHIENSSFARGKWVKTKQRDLTAVLFFCDYQDQPPLEEFETYGGKLEFPQHGFGFNCARGTLIIFPSDPHFINTNSQIHVGDLYQARIQIAATQSFIYNPQNFPGNYTTWFK
jgi:hypothetical protein